MVGRSNIVGLPISILMENNETKRTVTLTHSRTKNLKHITNQADILIVALGKADLLIGV